MYMWHGLTCMHVYCGNSLITVHMMDDVLQDIDVHMTGFSNDGHVNTIALMYIVREISQVYWNGRCFRHYDSDTKKQI